MIIQIKTLDALRAMIDQGHHDYFIALKPEGLRSSKEIFLTDDGKLSIFSAVSGTNNIYDDAELAIFTNIPEAMDKGAFYLAN